MEKIAVLRGHNFCARPQNCLSRNMQYCLASIERRSVCLHVHSKTSRMIPSCTRNQLVTAPEVFLFLFSLPLWVLTLTAIAGRESNKTPIHSIALRRVAS